MPRYLWLLMLSGLAARASGLSDDDAAALALQAAPAAPAATQRTLRVTIEGAEADAQQPGAAALDEQRLSLDARLDAAPTQGLRAVVAERLDRYWVDSPASTQNVGTLKEAYLGWQPDSDLVVEAGRVNARQGVAYGYNPTDFFRADSIRSLVSLDPNSLRENRLGTVMLRTQALWNSGSMTTAFAPDITDRASTAALNPDWAATNSSGRWLLAFSEQLYRGWTPQLLAYGDEHHSAQFGLDLTAGFGPSVVAFVEAAGGRSKSLLAQTIDSSAGDAFRGRASGGFTYSFRTKLSITFEYEYNGAGATSRGWEALRMGNPAQYGAYRQFALQLQDLPTQSNAFLYASWEDFIFRHLVLSGFIRVDLLDHSRLPYVEMRRHWDSVDLALRWQNVAGNDTSDYGASPQRQTWQLVLDYYW